MTFVNFRHLLRESVEHSSNSGPGCGIVLNIHQFQSLGAPWSCKRHRGNFLSGVFFLPDRAGDIEQMTCRVSFRCFLEGFGSRGERRKITGLLVLLRFQCSPDVSPRMSALADFRAPERADSRWVNHWPACVAAISVLPRRSLGAAHPAQLQLPRSSPRRLPQDVGPSRFPSPRDGRQ